MTQPARESDCPPGRTPTVCGPDPPQPAAGSTLRAWRTPAIATKPIGARTSETGPPRRATARRPDATSAPPSAMRSPAISRSRPARRGGRRRPTAGLRATTACSRARTGVRPRKIGKSAARNADLSRADPPRSGAGQGWGRCDTGGVDDASEIHRLAGEMLQEILRRAHLAPAPELAAMAAEEARRIGAQPLVLLR